MNPLTHTHETVTRLVQALPVDDVWFFETGAANECEFPKPFHLVLFVREEAEFHEVETKANEMLLQERADMDVHAFPHAAIYQTPRPLIVKMAFSVGECVFQR